MAFIEGSRGVYKPIKVCESFLFFFTGVRLETFVDGVTSLSNKLLSNIILLPSQVLFDTPIYEQALQTCWHMGSYKSQVRSTVAFLITPKENCR